MRPLLCLVFACVHAAAATPIDNAQSRQLKYEIAGVYKLETGRSVRLVHVDEKLYIDLNRTYRRELRAVAPNLLASRDGKLTVHYMPQGSDRHILLRHEGFPAHRRLGEDGWLGR